MKIVNGILFTESGFYRGTLQVENGGIVSIAAPSPEDGGEGCVDAAGGYVLPGLLDIHIHGYAGCDASDPDPQALRRMARAMAREGVTGFLGTTMALPRSELRQAAGNFAAFRSSPEGDGAVLWGMHMEGPFFSRGKRGAQAESAIVPPDIPLFEEINRASGGMIRLVDVAPELPGALPFIRRAAQTCAVSLAHTEADYDTAAQALRQGADHITHLYNAMPPYAHRAPGVIGAAADFARYCELIGDGVHLHPAVVRQTFSFFGGDRICLISDWSVYPGRTGGAGGKREGHPARRNAGRQRRQPERMSAAGDSLWRTGGAGHPLGHPDSGAVGGIGGCDRQPAPRKAGRPGGDGRRLAGAAGHDRRADCPPGVRNGRECRAFLYEVPLLPAWGYRRGAGANGKISG